MFARADRSRMMLAVAVAVAIVVVAIPTCQMIGCSMDMSLGMMRISTHSGPSVGNPCDGLWVTSAGSQYGVPPNEFAAALLSLVAVLAMTAVLFSPRVEMRSVRVVDANAPPPPLEPLGERFVV